MPTSGNAVMPTTPASIGLSLVPTDVGSALAKIGACVLHPTLSDGVPVPVKLLGVTLHVIVFVAGAIETIDIVVTPPPPVAFTVYVAD
jgi:hypothetical protein